MGIRTKTLIATAVLIGGSVLTAGSAFAQSGSEKPGWGFGDKHHVHTGPPGLSVRPPGDDDHNFSQLREELRHLFTRLRLQFFQGFFNKA